MFIDSHPDVLSLNRLLYPHLPRISGIAIDIVFDYLLAKEWEKFHHQELTVFLSHFFQYVQDKKDFLPSEYSLLLDRLWNNKMLHQYVDINTIDRIAAHIESRLSFETNLQDTKSVYLAYQSEFENAFHQYMKDAQEVFIRTKK
jgi:acyl carrier protein phosphodiesterase